MKLALSALVLCASSIVGCAAQPVDVGTARGSLDAGGTADGGGDADKDAGPNLGFALGPRGTPFKAWSDGDHVGVVAGIQGGFHTLHTAAVDATTVDRSALSGALVRVNLEKSSTVLAAGSWEIDASLWKQDGSLWTTNLPRLVFETDVPVGDEARLVGGVDLPDGRSDRFSVNLVVDQPQ